ncbi:MAG: PVC-type heme-binding CxxCH protein [Isosphaeraceae bacterium]
MRLRLASLALFVSVLPSQAIAQRAPFSIPDPDPEVERQSFLVADGFEVNLFAADPLLAKPIQMNFDPQGRLWVVSSEVYPQIEPGQKADDKVLILEDRDGDGEAEVTTVFADGLLIPTGVEPGDGGAYVANSTELLHLKDQDGDGKADVRRVVLSGFGTEDTHHILHTLRWGFDGQLYFNQSIYIHSHIETPLGVRRLGGGGIWEFRPETYELGVFIRGLVNPWGHHFDRWGQNFATDGAGGEGINYALPGAYYFTAVDAVRVLPGLNPGSPKHCGLEVASGRHLPESWRGSLLTNDFRGNRVCRFTLSDDGAGFASREQPELIKTKHVAFRPIDVKMGPDGAIYVADWYNPIIQHGEVDFRDPRRDHTRGRIWRITAKGRPLAPRPKLVGAPVADLLDALKAPEDWTRAQAKRVLKERGAEEVVPALAAWVKALDPADPDFEHQRLEALWTYQSLDVVEPALLDTLLRSNDPNVRGAATRVVRYWSNRLSDPLGPLADRVRDDHPRVRLEAVRSLAALGTARAASVALRALDRPVDRFLDYALWLTARDLAPAWLPEVKAGRFDLEGKPERLIFALQAVGSGEVVGPLLAALRDGAIPEAQEESALTLAATLGQPADLAAIFELALKEGGPPASRRAALLGGLEKAARQRQVFPEGDLSRVAPLLDAADRDLRAAAVRVAGVWKLGTLRDRLEGLARSASDDRSLREAAIDALAQLGSPEARAALDRLAGGETPRTVQATALLALAGLDPVASAGKAVAWLSESRDPSEAEAVVARFARIKGGTSALAKALEGRTLPPDAVKLALRAARASGPEDPALVQALRQAGGLGDAPKPLTGPETLALLADVASQGDARRGEAVFRKPENQCLKCHAIGGAGGLVGPGLESVGASAPADYLLDSLVEPGKAIKENYHSTVVATTDGQIISGIKVRQNDQELVLRDAEDREVAIPLSRIEEQKPGGSLMPAGLVEPLTRAELVDLVRFLSELGKIGPYSLSKARMVRRWQVLEVTPAAYTELRRWGLQTVAEIGNRYVDLNGRGGGALTWSPAYSQVAGDLPKDALPPFQLGPLPGSGAGIGPTGFARFQLDVTTPGPVQLSLNDPSGLTIWVDGTTVEPSKAITLDLTPGLHTVTLAVGLNERLEGLAVSLEDAPGSPARARVVLGK